MRWIEYGEGLRVGYRWYLATHRTPLFPFGFGLTYGARFTLSSPRISPSRISAPRAPRDGRALAQVSFTVGNGGSRTANEVAQVYVDFPAAVGEPPRRLVGWANVTVAPHGRRSATVTLDESALAYWSPHRHRWRIAPGSYAVYVGSSADDAAHRVGFEVAR